MTSTIREFGLLLGLATAFHAGLALVGACLLVAGIFQAPSWSSPPEEASNEDDAVVVVVEPDVAPTLALENKPRREEAIRFVRTNDQQVNDPPTELETAKFISDRTTHAASEKAPDPNGNVNLPSQKGHDSPVWDLANRQFSQGEYSPEERANTGPMHAPLPPSPPMLEAPQPKPKAVPQSQSVRKELPPTLDPSSDLKTREPQQTPKETAMKEAQFEKLFPEEALPKVAPKDQPKVPSTPPQPTSGSPGAPRGKDAKAATIQTLKNNLRGAISNRGQASVEAAGTAQGKYLGQVETAISQRFTPACMKARDRITYGAVEVEFDLNLQGSVENLRITNPGQSNPILQDLVLGVVLEAKLPPIPKELFDYLIGNRLHITYGFLFH